MKPFLPYNNSLVNNHIERDAADTILYVTGEGFFFCGFSNLKCTHIFYKAHVTQKRLAWGCCKMVTIMKFRKLIVVQIKNLYHPLKFFENIPIIIMLQDSLSFDYIELSFSHFLSFPLVRAINDSKNNQQVV